MARSVTCDHLNKLSDVLGKELWQNKETLKCFDCGCPGPNLWICLQSECHHIGCSEINNDHSTWHQKNLPTHCVHMNVSTERIWCYACEREVHAADMDAATHAVKLKHTQPSPDSTSLGGSPTARLGLDRGGFNISLGDDDDDGEVDEEGDFGDGDNEGKPNGLVGLQNMGNTCYMNAALQALSNTPPLTQHFLDCAAAVHVLAADKKPGLSRSYQKLVNEIWNKKTRGSVVPNGILYGIRNVHPMFRGYHQHDTQEFLRCFMDQLHEELKERVGGTEANPPPGGVTRQPTVAADGNGNDNLSLYGDGQRGRRRARRRSPAPSTLSESRGEGYYSRVHTQSESGGGGSSHSAVQVGGVDTRLVRHRRSASFGGSGIAASTAYAALARDTVLADEASKPACASDSDGSAEERYETCSSGANSDAADAPLTHACKRKKESPPCPSNSRGTETGDTRTSTGSSSTQGGAPRYRSVISDVFDGKLLSSVQCLTCDRISTRMETFQDLSLPIPSREHIAVLRGSQQLGNAAVTCSDAVYSAASQDGWLWWLLSWLRSWFYGPVVSLQDCLAAFFSADELKGDNMYSCERCNKLRNGVKYSRVVRLPEVLCVHLKRFRHELMFSAKVAARVSFPLRDLDMRPYLHKDCTSTVSSYSLSAVICHAGTAGGGHYTCVARNARARAWYEFDDQCVTPLAPDQVAAVEAYVLFYKKTNPQMAALRQKAAELLESSANNELDDMKFYISKQWINKFKTWAEPGAIDNSDFVCAHGGVRPDRAPHVHQLAAVVSQPLWEFLHANFGGGPACNHVHECGACRRAAERLKQRQVRELLAFLDLHAKFQEQECPTSVYAISMNWFRQWQAFVREKSHEPPPPVDNEGILTKINVAQDSQNLAAGTAQTYILKPGSDHAQLSEELWRFFIDIYGGGPEVKLKSVTAYERTNDYPTSYVTNQHSQSCSNVASSNQDSYYSLPHNSTQRSTEFTNQRRLVKKKSESDHEEPLHNHNQFGSPKPGLYADIYNGDIVRNTQSLQNIELAKSKNVVVNNSGQSSDESARPQRMSCDSDDEVSSSRRNRTSMRYARRHFRHRQSASADSDEDLQTNTDSISYASDTKVYNNKAKDYNNSVNCVMMENGFNDNSSSAEHDTNENSVSGKCAGLVGCSEKDVAIELPNLESISLKAKSSSAVNSRQNAAKSRRRRTNNAQGTKLVHSPTNGCPPRDGGDRRLVK